MNKIHKINTTSIRPQQSPSSISSLSSLLEKKQTFLTNITTHQKQAKKRMKKLQKEYKQYLNGFEIEMNPQKINKILAIVGIIQRILGRRTKVGFEHIRGPLENGPETKAFGSKYIFGVQYLLSMLDKIAKRKTKNQAFKYLKVYSQKYEQEMDKCALQIKSNQFNQYQKENQKIGSPINNYNQSEKFQLLEEIRFLENTLKEMMYDCKNQKDQILQQIQQQVSKRDRQEQHPNYPEMCSSQSIDPQSRLEMETEMGIEIEMSRLQTQNESVMRPMDANIQMLQKYQYLQLQADYVRVTVDQLLDLCGCGYGNGPDQILMQINPTLIAILKEIQNILEPGMLGASYVI